MLIKDCTRAISPVSVKSNVIPSALFTFLNRRRLPPYRSSEAIICASCLNSFITVATAAIPDEKAKAAAPPSNCATVFSR